MTFWFLGGLALAVIALGYRKSWAFQEPIKTQQLLSWKRFVDETDSDERRRLAMIETPVSLVCNGNTGRADSLGLSPRRES